MANIKESFDELLALGELDLFLEKVKECTKMKVSNREFAGMEVDDVVQEVLINVYKSMSKYDSSKAKASTYFNCVINNQIKNCLIKAGTRYNLMVVNAATLIDQRTSVSSKLRYNEDSYLPGKTHAANIGKEDEKYSLVEIIEVIFNGNLLTDKEKKVFKLKAAGYSFREIGNILGYSAGNIHYFFKGIKKKLELYYI